MENRKFYFVYIMKRDRNVTLDVLANNEKEAKSLAFQMSKLSGEDLCYACTETEKNKFKVYMEYNLNDEKGFETHEFKSLEKAIRCLEERSEWALGVLRSKYDEKEISSGISEDHTYISAECGDDSYYVKLFPSI